MAPALFTSVFFHCLPIQSCRICKGRRIILKPSIPAGSRCVLKLKHHSYYNFFQASSGTNNVSGLLVRAQNCSDFTPGKCVACNVKSSEDEIFVGSVLLFAKAIFAADGTATFDKPYPVFSPDPLAPQDESRGTEDPRIKFDSATGIYHLFYTCFGDYPTLCHATTTNPTLPLAESRWTRLGGVFGGLRDAKSGALLIRPSPPHYLYWGAGSTQPQSLHF